MASQIASARSVLARILACMVASVLLPTLVPRAATAAPTPTVTIGDVVVTEGNAGATAAIFSIQVSPRPRTCCPLSVMWATANGTAGSPADYSTASGVVTLTRSTGTAQVTVPVVGDALDEPNETFAVNLSGLVGSPGRIGDAQGVATITDDDPLPSIAIDDVAVDEGDAGTTTAGSTATLSAPSGRTVTVNWASSDGTATQPDDYPSGSGTLTFVPGDVSESIPVTVTGDTLDEGDETFLVSLASPTNATVSDSSGLATVTDDDPLPTLSIGDASLGEGDAGASTVTFTVSLAPASGRTVTVGWSASDGSATEPSDYVDGYGTLTFAPGDTSETIDVSVNGDVQPELDETFTLDLAGPLNATVADGAGVGTIFDDEAQAVIDVDDPSVIEGASGATTMDFAVTLSNPSPSTVTVDWTTTDGTADAGADYLGGSGTVTFAPLETSRTVQVTVQADGTYESEETLFLDLSDPSNAPLGDTQGVGTIANDDDAPGLSIGDAVVVEGQAGTSTLAFDVTSTGDTEVDTTIGFASSEGTATDGSDYVGMSGTLTIPAEDAGGTIEITVNADTTYEPNETLVLTLSGPGDAVIDDGSATGTIRNDDKAPTKLTLTVVKKRLTVRATGILEPTRQGHRVSVTLSKKKGDRYVKLAAKTVSIRSIGDRDGDGKPDGSYLASFARPAARGTYRLVARFAATATHEASSRKVAFRLS